MEAYVRLPDQTFDLTRALLIYESSGAGEAPLVTGHTVERGARGAAFLGPGGALTAREARRVLRELGEAGRACGYLPERVLSYSGAEQLTWYRPALPRALYFESRDEHLNALSGARFPQPRLVFQVREGRLQVWAVRRAGRPRPDTILYHAPFFNVHSRGAVCHGSMETPASGASPQNIEAWEDAFFRSAFTHGSGTRFLKGSAGYVTTLERLAEAFEKDPERARFPTGRLIRTRKRLRDVL